MLGQDSSRFCSRPPPSRARLSMQSLGCSKEKNVKCRMYIEVRLEWVISTQLVRITGEGMSCVRGKNTCEAPEISAAILLQVSKN